MYHIYVSLWIGIRPVSYKILLKPYTHYCSLISFWICQLPTRLRKVIKNLISPLYYPVYTMQKLSGSWSGLWSGSRSRGCTRYMRHSLFNTTKRIALWFIVQSLLHRNPLNIWVKIIQIAIHIKSLHGTKFRDPDHFPLCKRCTVFDK